jgi:glyceraldehyde 3-phosphate dehydrogenase
VSADAKSNVLVVGDQRILLTATTEPSKCAWREAGCQLVIECSGKLASSALASAHLGGCVAKVLISAPAKDECVTVVMGVNDGQLRAKCPDVISGAYLLRCG